VASGNHLWSETYDGVFSDTIFVIQSNIAKRIASSLDAVISPEMEASIDKIPTTNVAAYDLYIKADYERYKHLSSQEKEDAKAAHDLYNQALQLDPDYLLAITGKADLFNVEQIHDSALIYAERAIQIDPNFNRGYASKAFYYQFTGQADLFEEYMLKAISLPPYDDFWLSYHSNLGGFYTRQNDVLKALPYLKKGLEKEENQYIPTGYFQIIRFYAQIGDYENADHYIRKFMDVGGDCAGIGWYQWLLQVQGKFSEAFQFINSRCGEGACEPTTRNCTRSFFELSWLMGEYKKTEQYFLRWKETKPFGLFYQSMNYEIGHVYFQLGRTEEAEQILKEALQDLQARLDVAVNNGRRPRTTHKHLSRIYAFQGQRKKALEHLTEYANLGFEDGFHDFILLDPFFESLRDDPEFKAIVKQAQEEKATQRAQIKEMEERGELTL
jgi:tetratricopeptide (TPR) repeat protein